MKTAAPQQTAVLRPPLNVFLATCMVFTPIGPALARQAGEKLIRADDPAQIRDAVMISNISVNAKTVECGLFIKPPAVLQPVTPFQADSDWLQQMTISLVNRPDKTIVFGAIIIHFLDTGDCRSTPCAEEEIHLGQIPAIAAYYGTGQPLGPENSQRTPLDWKSEQTIVVHVGDYLPEIEQRLTRFLPVTSVTEVAIHLGSFFFDDGVRWGASRYSFPDRYHPGKFKYFPDNYFPGKSEHNWPPGYKR